MIAIFLIIDGKCISKGAYFLQHIFMMSHKNWKRQISNHVCLTVIVCTPLMICHKLILGVIYDASLMELVPVTTRVSWKIVSWIGTHILNIFPHEYRKMRVKERERASYVDVLCYSYFQSMVIKIRQWICQLSKIQIKIVTVGGRGFLHHKILWQFTRLANIQYLFRKKLSRWSFINKLYVLCTQTYI